VEPLLFQDGTGVSVLDDIVRRIAVAVMVYAEHRPGDDDESIRQAVMSLVKHDRALLAFVHDRLLTELDDTPSSAMTQRALHRVRLALDPEEMIRRHHGKGEGNE
jgi:hypothetical protein